MVNIFVPQFLICDNYEYPNFVFLLHPHYPRFLAIVENNFETETKYLECKRKYNLYATVEIDGEDEVIAVIDLYDDISKLTADELAQLMSKMGDWYFDEIASL